MSRFYIGLNPRYQYYPWLPSRINVMVSAGGYWGGQDWRRKTKYPILAGSRWLDSGGFTLLNRYGDYPFDLLQYHNLVCWLRPNFYASLDYPCEPEITRTLSRMTNRERIDATIENVARMIEWEFYTYPSKLVPVIQGYSQAEYIYCIEQLASRNLIRDYMAVGSMCRRISSQELHRLIPAIYNLAKDCGVKQLHFFGLKLSPDLADLGEFIYSRDSAVSLDSYDKELRAARGGRRYPKGTHEKRLAFMSFLDRLEKMGLIYKG